MSLKKKLITSIIVFFIVVVHIGTIREGQNWGTDFFLYVQHAKNITEGKNYNDTHYVYNPHTNLQPIAYPPIYPLFLIPVYKKFGINYYVLKIEQCVFIGLVLFSLFLLLSQKISFLGLIFTLVSFGLNPFCFMLKEVIGADFLFLFFSFMSLWLMEVLFAQKKKILYSVLLGVFLYLAFATKHMGLVLLCILPLYELIRIKKISKYSILSICIFGILCLIQSQWVGLVAFKNQGSLFKFDLFMNILNLRFYPGQPSIFFENGIWSAGRQILYVVVLLLAMLGFIKKIKLHGLGLIDLFLIVFPIPLMFWPFAADVRYLLPIMPFLFYYVYFYLTQRAKKYAVFIFLVFCFCYGAKYSTSKWGAWNELDHPQAQELFQFVRTKTNQNDLIIFHGPTHMGALIQRNSIYDYIAEKDEDWFRYYASMGATYYVVKNVAQRRPDFVSRNSVKFKLIFSNALYKVFRILWK